MAEPVTLSLTNFLNFVTKTGIQKLRFVEQLKRDEQFDFYGPLRDHIKQVHKTDKPKKELQTVLQGLANKQKAKCYPPVVKGYQKFWGRRKGCNSKLRGWFFKQVCEQVHLRAFQCRA